MPAIPGVTNNGVILRGLSSLPLATEMLTVDPTGVMGRQAIPVGSFGSLTGSPSDNAALAAALAGKVSLSGDTMTGNLTINNASSILRLNNAGQDWQLRAQYGDLNIEPVSTANSVFVRAGSGQQVTLNVAGINRISATANGASVTGDIRSDRAGSLSHVSPQNNIVLYGGFAGYGIGFDGNGELGTIVNSTLRSRLGQHLGLGSAGQVRFNSAADTSGSWDTLVLRNATGPSLETRSAGGVRIRTLDGLSPANLDAANITGPSGQRIGDVGYGNALTIGNTCNPLNLSANNLRIGTNESYNATSAMQWQAGALTLGSAMVLGWSSGGANLSADSSIRRNASGPTLDTWSAGGLRVRSADGSAAAALDASSLTFGSHVRDANGVGLRSQSGYLTFYGFNTNATNDPTMSVQTDGVRIVGKTILGAANYSEAFGSEALKVGGNALVGGTRLDLFDANSGLWASGGILLRHGGAGVFVHNGSGAMVRSSDFIGWSSSTLSSASQMAGWFSDATDVISQRRGTNAQTSRLYNTFTSATNGEWLQQQWASNEARIGTAVGSAGGTQRNMVLGSWNAAGTWVPAMSVRPTDSAYPVKFHGSSGIWVGDQTTYEGGRIWTSVNAFELVNAGALLGTGSIKLTDWNANTALAQLSIHHTKNLSFAIDTDNDDATSAFYFLGGTHASGNPATNGLMKIEKGGNVGIGTMSPSAKLHVAGTVTANGALTVNNAAGIYESGSGRTVALTSNFSASTPGIGTTTNHDFCIYTNGANERLRFASTGLITASSNIALTGSNPQVRLGAVDQGYVEYSSGALNLGHTYASRLSVNATQVTSLVPIVTSQTITHGFQPLVANPSTVDITNGLIRAVKNTTSGELRFWANDGNVMKSVLFS